MLKKPQSPLKNESGKNGSLAGSGTSCETTPEKQNSIPEKRRPSTTRLVIKYDVGFGNQLYIRGKGANLSWDKGHLLKNSKNDEWIWETDQPFTACEFKILINDKDYENGENHPLSCGSSIQFTPKF